MLVCSFYVFKNLKTIPLRRNDKYDVSVSGIRTSRSRAYVDSHELLL